MSMVGKSVDQIGMEKPPSGQARAEQLMRPNAVERPDTQKGNSDLSQFVGGSGKPPGTLGQKGRI